MTALARNVAICAAALAVVRPAQPERHAHDETRRFALGDLTVLLHTLAAGGDLLLDVYLQDAGKVAAFRVSSDFTAAETVNVKAKTLPRWVATLFDAANATVRPGPERAAQATIH